MSETPTNGNDLDLENLGSPAASGTTSPRMLVPLFLVPLLIVVLIVAIFLGVGALIGTEKTVEQWIVEVESGGVNERWQAAANLTEISIRDPARLATPELRGRLRSLFVVAGPSDTRLRQWITKLWTAIGDAEAAPLCVDGIVRMQEELNARGGREGPNAELAVQELLNYIRALGVLGNQSNVTPVVALATEPDAAVRMAVIECVGALARKTIIAGGAVAPEAIQTLQRLHGDSDVWVRMNAALSLAKCGVPDGLPTLEAMLDRDWLKGQKLRFPDDGNYSVNAYDPAAAPIASALLAIELLMSGASERGSAPSSLREAVDRACRDPNPEIQRRAAALLVRLGG